jgi:hypothetical protein
MWVKEKCQARPTSGEPIRYPEHSRVVGPPGSQTTVIYIHVATGIFFGCEALVINEVISFAVPFH